MTAEDHRAGWFEREFVEIDDLGSGEFGRAIKVRRKDGPDGEVFAVKKSRRFEGSRQRSVPFFVFILRYRVTAVAD